MLWLLHFDFELDANEAKSDGDNADADEDIEADADKTDEADKANEADDANLAGNVADMSRHVADGTPCRSNFGQMGPCRRHNFFRCRGSLCRLEPTFTRYFRICM